MAETPPWAKDLVYSVCRKYRVSRPSIHWIYKDSEYSNGKYDYNTNKIYISAGTERINQKWVLLHELAHRLEQRDIHGAHFYRMAWRLYRLYRMPIRYCLDWEGSYKKKAIKVYWATRRGDYEV